MVEGNKQLAEALCRHCDAVGIKSSFARKMARCVERGLTSKEELDRMIASLGKSSPTQAASLHEWTTLCLRQHGVVFIPDSDLSIVHNASAPAPFTLKERRIIQSLDGGVIRFFFAKEGPEGDDRWYRRLATDRWYADDMVAVANALGCALERAYHTAQG